MSDAILQALMRGQYTLVPPVLADQRIASVRLDSDAILLAKVVGGGGVPYAQGLLHDISAAQLATILNTIPVARFNAVAPALADGEATELQCTPDGRLIVTSTSIAALSRYNSAGDDSDQSIIAAPGVLTQVTGYNAAVADRYFMLFDSLLLPVNGTAPWWVAIRVPPASHFSVTFGDGLSFPTGIYWAASTTRTTLTVTLGSDLWVSALLR